MESTDNVKSCEKRKREPKDEDVAIHKKNKVSSLQHLRKHSIIVVDTSDMTLISKHEPDDATTNPSLILQAHQNNVLNETLKECVCAHKSHIENCDDIPVHVVDDIYDELIVCVGCEILKLIPGKVSTEIDARLSFDTQKSVQKARQIIDMYEKKGVDRSRVMIKMASTWEGCEAAKELQKENIQCNMTLIFTLAQAIAAAEAKATLISPFVGRVLDWQKTKDRLDNLDRTYLGCEDPGVRSVLGMYKYYKKYKYDTTIMAASFRNVSEIVALCGLEKLTISPKLLSELECMEEEVGVNVNEDFNHDSVCDQIINFDQQTFRWMLNEDAMATEKLAEGIRKFDEDAKTLKELIKGIIIKEMKDTT